MDKSLLHGDYEYSAFKWINYVNLSTKQKCEVLRVRNQWDVRKWMTTTDLISLESHMKFIDKLSESTTSAYWAIYRDEQLVAGCSLVDIRDNGQAQSGIFTDTNLNIPGLGAIISICSYVMFFEHIGVEKLVGSARKTNDTVIKLNNLVGFDIVEEDDDYYYISLTKSMWENNKKRLLRWIH